MWRVRGGHRNADRHETTVSRACSIPTPLPILPAAPQPPRPARDTAPPAAVSRGGSAPGASALEGPSVLGQPSPHLTQVCVFFEQCPPAPEHLVPCQMSPPRTPIAPRKAPWSPASSIHIAPPPRLSWLSSLFLSPMHSHLDREPSVTAHFE